MRKKTKLNEIKREKKGIRLIFESLKQLEKFFWSRSKVTIKKITKRQKKKKKNGIINN